MRNKAIIALSIGWACLSIGCGAAVAPKELINAREAYAAAQQSDAKQLAQVQLEEARQATLEADRAFENGESQEKIQDLSYIAERKSQIAMSVGKTEKANRDQEAAAKEGARAQERYMEKQEKRLDQTERSLERTKLEKEKTAEELERERAARKSAEKKLSAALKSLDEIAKVKEESRGVVITLSGSVLFATGKWELLPIAKERLAEVTKAIMDQGFKRLVVEGHTDSRGSDSKNLELSMRRAEEVRGYLVSQGIPPAKITAVGKGEMRPVAPNSTPEGRANNRRVEIIVEPE